MEVRSNWLLASAKQLIYFLNYLITSFYLFKINSKKVYASSHPVSRQKLQNKRAQSAFAKACAGLAQIDIGESSLLDISDKHLKLEMTDIYVFITL